MPSNLNRRVARLENKGGGKERILYAVKFPGDSEADALKREGIEPTDDDLVVFIRRFGITAEGEPTCREI